VLFFNVYKLAVRRAHSDGAATVLLQSIAGISMLVLVPIFPLHVPTDLKLYLLLVAAGLCYALSNRLQTTARKHLQVSVVAVINQLSTVFLLVYGVTIFRHPLLLEKVIGAGCILGGNLLLLYRGGTFALNKYEGMAMVATLALATAMSIDIGIAPHFNLPGYILLTFLLPASIVAVAEQITPRDVFQEYAQGNKTYYVLAGMMWALAIFWALRAFQYGRVSVIVPLQATAVLMNVLVASIFLKERDHAVRKILAALFIIAGVCFTVWQ
jgi:drug/metabolite transporter (DMT)-like permease